VIREAPQQSLMACKIPRRDPKLSCRTTGAGARRPEGEALARIEIYSSLLCGYSYRAKKLLDSKGVAYEDIDVMLRPGRRAEMVARSGGRRSVPQIFVDGRHLGDCQELYALEAAGKLGPILEGAG